MRFDKELFLISQTIESDDVGNEIPVETRRKIFCAMKSARANEFYSAAVNGMKPELVFTIYEFEYKDEQKAEFQGKKYRIIRTYMKNSREMELVCERVAADVH